MPKPLVTFPDPLQVTLAALKAGRADLIQDVAFGTKALDVEAADAPSLPYAAVSIDSARGRYPVLSTPTVRVRVWHTTDAKGLDLAQKLRAVLLAYAGDADVRSFGEMTGPLPTTDPDSLGPLSYFTVAARLRPITL